MFLGGKTAKYFVSKVLRHITEKTLDIFYLPSDARRWQALQKLLPVALGDDPGVEYRKHAAVRRAADQSAQPLLQGDDRRRDRVAVEAVSAVIVDVALSRAYHRIGRYREGKLVDDHARKRLAAHIHSLPEARSGEEDGVRRRAEFVENARP